MAERGLKGANSVRQHDSSQRFHSQNARSNNSNVSKYTDRSAVSKTSQASTAKRSQNNRSFVGVGADILGKKEIVVDRPIDSPEKDPWNAIIKMDLQKFENENKAAKQRELDRRVKM
jgi:hypothetical protein